MTDRDSPNPPNPSFEKRYEWPTVETVPSGYTFKHNTYEHESSTMWALYVRDADGKSFWFERERVEFRREVGEWVQTCAGLAATVTETSAQ